MLVTINITQDRKINFWFLVPHLEFESLHPVPKTYKKLKRLKNLTLLESINEGKTQGKSLLL